MKKTFIIAEIGINHNGDIELAKKLIMAAKYAGADAVKFQKRTIDKVYSPEELDKLRDSPWGKTNRDQKLGLELNEYAYNSIDTLCKEIKIIWFASAWDLVSAEFLKKYNFEYNKIASPRLGHIELLRNIAKQHKYTFISTGMSTLEEIDLATEIFEQEYCPYELMHCNSQYPMSDEKANLEMIDTLQERYKHKKQFKGIGYSGHEVGLITSVAAAVMGATSIERHLTLDRAMYGSDQSASIEPDGFKRLIDYIRVVDSAIGDGIKSISLEEEKCRAKLWRIKDV